MYPIGNYGAEGQLGYVLVGNGVGEGTMYPIKFSGYGGTMYPVGTRAPFSYTRVLTRIQPGMEWEKAYKGAGVGEGIPYNVLQGEDIRQLCLGIYNYVGGYRLGRVSGTL